MIAGEIFGTPLQEALHKTFELHYILVCMVEDLSAELEKANNKNTKEEWMQLAHSHAWDKLAARNDALKKINDCNDFVKGLFYNHSK